MKVRCGYVSNSSSSSFIVNVDNISLEDYEEVIHYFNKVSEDSWDMYMITENNKTLLYGYTYMDNGAKEDFEFVCRLFAEDSLVEIKDRIARGEDENYDYFDIDNFYNYFDNKIKDKFEFNNLDYSEIDQLEYKLFNSENSRRI